MPCDDLMPSWREAVAAAERALGPDVPAPVVPAQDPLSRESAELRVRIDEMARELEESAVRYAMVRRPLRAAGAPAYTEADRDAIDARYAQFLGATRRAIEALRAAAARDGGLSLIHISEPTRPY